MNTSNKNWILILIAVIVLALLWASWQYGLAPLLDNDTTATIDKDLNTVDIGNPDQDLNQLDADLNQL